LGEGGASISERKLEIAMREREREREREIFWRVWNLEFGNGGLEMIAFGRLS
jgi:hypothetical protein